MTLVLKIRNIFRKNKRKNNSRKPLKKIAGGKEVTSIEGKVV